MKNKKHFMHLTFHVNVEKIIKELYIGPTF